MCFSRCGNLHTFTVDVGCFLLRFRTTHATSVIYGIVEHMQNSSKQVSFQMFGWTSWNILANLINYYTVLDVIVALKRSKTEKNVVAVVVNVVIFKILGLTVSAKRNWSLWNVFKTKLLNLLFVELLLEFFHFLSKEVVFW